MTVYENNFTHQIILPLFFSAFCAVLATFSCYSTFWAATWNIHLLCHTAARFIIWMTLFRLKKLDFVVWMTYFTALFGRFSAFSPLALFLRFLGIFAMIISWVFSFQMILATYKKWTCILWSDIWVIPPLLPSFTRGLEEIQLLRLGSRKSSCLPTLVTGGITAVHRLCWLEETQLSTGCTDWRKSNFLRLIISEETQLSASYDDWRKPGV